MKMQTLFGKNALITGAGKGIGKSIARTLAMAGATIIINYKTSKHSAEELATEINQSGGKAIAMKADLTDAEDVASLFKQVSREVGPVDILINNAGINQPQSTENSRLNNWGELLNINLTSAFLTIQAAVPSMKKNHYGRIINISSAAAQSNTLTSSPYSGTNGGMLGLTHSYASLLAKYGITVNTITSASPDTQVIRGAQSINAANLRGDKLNQPEEVADVALLLACNGYVSGQTINVNSGVHTG